MCKNSTRYNRTPNFGLCGRTESKKTQKIVFRSALRPHQISFSHDQAPHRAFKRAVSATDGCRRRIAKGTYLDLNDLLPLFAASKCLWTLSYWSQKACFQRICLQSTRQARSGKRLMRSKIRMPCQPRQLVSYAYTTPAREVPSGVYLLFHTPFLSKSRAYFFRAIGPISRLCSARQSARLPAPSPMLTVHGTSGPRPMLDFLKFDFNDFPGSNFASSQMSLDSIIPSTRMLSLG